MKSKETNKRIERQEWASLSERRTRVMAALQKQDAGWMSFDHLIAMIDHFKLNVGSADTYMTLELPTLRRLWLKKQLVGMGCVVSDVGEPNVV